MLRREEQLNVGGSLLGALSELERLAGADRAPDTLHFHQISI
jgi:hypothetical protein